MRLVKLSHMRYQFTSFKEITVFLRDFGMRLVKRTDDKLWFAGYGPDQYVYVAEKGPVNKFMGGVFVVESQGDLERASRIPGASAIEKLHDAPGGGQRVTLTDPEGMLVGVIFGQEPRSFESSYPEKLIYNYEDTKERIDKFQRFKEGPAAVHKLGHYGLCTSDFDTMWRWYMKHFNLVPTDWLYVETDGKQKDVACFAHIDRGSSYVDHHTFFLSSNATSHAHHCSFEVHDFDTQALGHDWLVSKGYKLVWGLGRHIIGSQLFDYWWDTAGNMVEHYADGDLINDKTPIGRSPATHESLAVWGPSCPVDFLD